MFTSGQFLSSGLIAGFILATFADVAGGVRLANAQDTVTQGQKSKLTFEIYEDRAMEFRWRLKSANGKTMATGGEGYKAKADCKKAVKRIQTDLEEGKSKFEVYEDRAGEHRWRLKSSNGQIVAASSEGYKAKADCENAIESIKRSAPTAEVNDES